MTIEMHKLIYNEYEVVKGLINNPVTQQEERVLEYYCGKVNSRLIDRVNRYLLMNEVTDEEERIEFISKQLDKYNMLYNRQVIEHQIRNKDFKVLRQNDVKIKYYKSEIDLIKSLEGWKLQKFAWAILTYAKHNLIVHGESGLLNDDDLIVDLYNLSGAANTNKENIYLLFHELAKRKMVEVPISLHKFEDKISVNYVGDESEEVVYELENTEIFKLGEVFEKLFGEYRDPQSKCVLEISLVEDYCEVHNSIAQAMKTHNERSAKRVTKSAISECMKLSRLSIGDSAWIELNWEDSDNEDYIKKVIQFVRECVKVNYRKAKKMKGKWIVTHDFLGSINESGEILFQMK